jgi:hypothetical protein
MTQLSTLFTLAGLSVYIEGRLRILRGENGLTLALAGLCLFGLLAALSKENGALIIGFALTIELVCFRLRGLNHIARLALYGFFAASTALPLILLTTRFPMQFDRLLSESRILWDYVLWTFVPIPSWMGMYHDDIQASTSLLAPPTTIIALTCFALAATVAWCLRNRSPGCAFALTWFLVGHSMESSVLPLELVFEHRNYLPMVGLLLGVTCWATSLLSPLSSKTGASLGIIVVVGLAILTAERSYAWSSNLSFAQMEASNHPLSSRAQYEAGRAILIAGIGDRQKAEEAALPYFERSMRMDPEQINSIIAWLVARARLGQVQPSDIQLLAQQLRSNPHPTRVNPFLDLLVTASEEPILGTADIKALVEAALANPAYQSQIRAMIFNDYGAYLFNMAHDYQGAISATLTAAQWDPKNPYFELNLAKIALQLKQHDVARQHLLIAQQLNKMHVYDDEIRKVELALSQR